MILKEIIKASKWEDVRKSILSNYPDQENVLKGYEIVYKKLRSKAPLKSEMVLVCELNEPFLKNDEPFYEMYGTNGTKREDGEFEKFSLSLSPWSKWLGSRFSETTLKNLTKEEIIAHCLYDMTFHGFSEADLKKAGQKLDKQVKDMESKIRFVIVSILSPEKPRWHLFFNVKDETYCDEIDTATLFKKKKYAKAVLKVLNKGKSKDNVITKITTKNKKRKVLKYYK